jgi:hypothetical protein
MGDPTLVPIATLGIALALLAWAAARRSVWGGVAALCAGLGCLRMLNTDTEWGRLVAFVAGPSAGAAFSVALSLDRVRRHTPPEEKQ